jgi:hypothetical protein
LKTADVQCRDLYIVRPLISVYGIYLLTASKGLKVNVRIPWLQRAESGNKYYVNFYSIVVCYSVLLAGFVVYIINILKVFKEGFALCICVFNILKEAIFRLK